MRKFILHTYDKSKSFDLNTETALAAESLRLGGKDSATNSRYRTKKAKKASI